jgi:hypothetical protein
MVKWWNVFMNNVRREAYRGISKGVAPVFTKSFFSGPYSPYRALASSSVP